MMIRTIASTLVLATASISLVGCPSGSSSFNSAALGVDSSNYLYVASGSCYGGGVATSAGPANTVVKYNLGTGQLEQVLIDYNQLAPGDTPVSIQSFDATHLLVLVENTSGRRIDIVNKDGSGFETYLVNSTALSTVTRSLAVLKDSSLLVSRSSAIEKFNPGKARVLVGVNPFINAPGTPCSTSTTLISSAVADPVSGKGVFTHAGATPNNKIGVVSATGYSVAADCNSGTTAPNTTALPTRALFHPSGALLVAYGSTTLASNFIYSYTFNGTTGAISGATLAYGDSGATINGPSSMAADPTTGDVFIANVASTFNTIERMHFNAGVLTHATTTPFIESSAYTRCVSDMTVAP